MIPFRNPSFQYYNKKIDSRLSSLVVLNPFQKHIILTKSFKKTQMLKQVFKLAYVELFRGCGHDHEGLEIAPGFETLHCGGGRRIKSGAENGPQPISLFFTRPPVTKTDKKPSIAHNDLAFGDRMAHHEEVNPGETSQWQAHVSIDDMSRIGPPMFPEAFKEQAYLLPRLLNYNFGTATYLTN